MKLVTVEDLREGDVIASDVLLEDYTVVLSKGTIVKAPYIDKLRELGIFTTYIEELQENADPQPSAQKKATTDPPQKPATQAAKPTTPASKPAAAKAPEQKAPVAPKAPEQKTPVPPKAPEQKAPVAPKAPTAQTPKPSDTVPKKKLSIEKVTILRDDVEEQVKSKIKDILEMHIYQQTEGLEKIADAAQSVITDILEEEEVVEKVYDVKERSADIYEHSLQVCTIATLISLKLGLTKKQVYDVSIASLIHDLGLRYLVVRYEDQDINLLPARDQEEYKKHPIYAYTAIKNETWLSDTAKEIVMNHHEKKDKSGYPLGTDLVSRMTQIVGVCDEFDELICGIGKSRVRVHEAINNIRNYSGIWYDSDIVDAFLQLIAVYPFGSKVRTNRGEIGIVMRQNLHFPERPVLRIVEDKYGQAIHAELVVDLIKDTTVVIQEVIK
ncbi:MAG: HD domain-containing protein [Lachnospiraceae bacterium]|nr:HD domain-containing protein [Lachnospiraceae bacterium]MDE7271968.1 HD domain-containing protein [Lachnospiraceae bacterium]